MSGLIELSKKILENYEKEKNYEKKLLNISRLEEINDYLKENKDRKRILILGMNPAEYKKEITLEKYADYDRKHLEYVVGLKNEDKKKIKDLTNVTYFKAHYDLFEENTVQMSWPIIKECQETIEKNKIHINEEIDPQKALLIFGDLIYYHHTKQKDLEEFINEKKNNNKDDLYSIVKSILEEHITMFDPNLILVTNSYVSKLLWEVYCNNKGYNDDVIKIKTKNNKEKTILLSGMVSGQRAMDVFSKVRLKNRIKGLLE